MAGAVARTTGRPGSAVGVSWYARAAIIEHDANVDMAHSCVWRVGAPVI